MIIAALIKLVSFKFAVIAPGCEGSSFFGIPHWWEYLNVQKDSLGQCSPVFHFPNDILAVAMAVIDILLRVAGIAAVLSIILAGITYLTSMGSSDKATSARKRIQNSLIGLAIVLIASAAVAFIGNSLI